MSGLEIKYGLNQTGSNVVTFNWVKNVILCSILRLIFCIHSMDTIFVKRILKLSLTNYDWYR